MALPDSSKTAARVYAKCVIDFEYRIKKDFRNNGQSWTVDVGIKTDFPEAGIAKGQTIYTNKEILTCFEPVLDRILEMIQNQIIAIEARSGTLKVCHYISLSFSASLIL
jgi:hypothetical protein